MSQKNSVSGDDAPDLQEGSLDVADNMEEVKDESNTGDVENFDYKEVSEMSEVTQESFPEGFINSARGAVEDLVDFDKLVQQTQKKLVIQESEQDINETLDIIDDSRKEGGDEFIKNFFIKFGMKRSMDSFQQEWFELKTKQQLNFEDMPKIPQVYKDNIELSNVLAALQKEVDEARIIAEKSRSTYDKLRKQRDFQKINHRRVQQEKQKLNSDINKCKSKYDSFQQQFDSHSAKYEAAVKEKMLMKLEKDRLIAKVQSLEANLGQVKDDEDDMIGGTVNNSQIDFSPAKTQGSKFTAGGQSPGKQSSVTKQMRGTGKPTSIGKFSVANQKKLTPIPKTDPQNPHINEDYEPCHSNMSQAKVFKGHLMGVTSLAYNSKKDILATGSDDTTWKLWSVPNGDLLMSGEGHSDWIGGVCFHPKGNFLATASGDGYVKIWDFINAKCAMQYSEHGQPVWKVDYHHDGDFLLSCSMDHTVKLWDMNLPNTSRFTFRGHVDSVNSVQWCPYSTMFVSGAGDKTVSLWDIRSNLCIQTFYGHNNAVNTVKFSNDGKHIVSGDCDGINKIWDIRMVKEQQQFDSGLSSTNCAIFDKSGTKIVVGNEDGAIKVFNIQSGEAEGELKGHEDAVLEMVWDNTKEPMLLSASSDCSFRIWQ